MNRGKGLERGPGPQRSAPLLPCGKGWLTLEEAQAAAGDTGAVPFKCPNKACPKYHLNAVPAPQHPLSPEPPVTPRRSRPETGFPRAVKLLARTRAGGGDPEQAVCECCGKWLGLYGGQIQHRIARGIGGSKSRVINGITNAAVLCGNRYEGCNQKAEDREQAMKDAGWYIPDGKGPEHDPRLVPVISRRDDLWLPPEWFTEDGRRVTEAPGAEAAA